MPGFMSKSELADHIKQGESLGVPARSTYEQLKKNGWTLEGDPVQQSSGFSNSMSPFSVENRKPQSNFLTSVGNFIGSISPYAKEVGQYASGAVQNAASGINQVASDYHSGRQGFASSALQATGALSGGVANTLASPFVPIVSPIMSSVAKPIIQSYQQQSGLIGPIVSKAGEMAQSFSASHPEATANIKAVGQIASLPLAMSSVEPTINAVGGTVAGIGKRTLATLPTMEMPHPFRKSLEDVISTGMEKGVKPQFRGQMRTSATALKDYNVKATEAVKNILDQENLKTISYVDDTGEIVSQGHAPRNLGEFAQAIEQTKKRIFEQYSALTQQATGQGKEIDLHSIAQKLLDYADDPVKQLADKSKTKYAQEVAADLLRHGKLDPIQTENLIKELNQGLVKAYADKGAKGISEVDMSIANELRNQLDNVVLESTGKEYQSLKNAYGALKTIEKDVGHRALIVARQNVKNLPQMTDIFTGGDLVAGVVTGNPALIAKGAAGKAISTYYKFMNSPDTQIMRMFSKANSILNTPAPEMSLLGKAQASAKASLLADQVGSTPVLPQPSKTLSTESSPSTIPEPSPSVNPPQPKFTPGGQSIDDLAKQYGGVDNIPLDKLDDVEAMRVQTMAKVTPELQKKFPNFTPEEKSLGVIGGSDSAKIPTFKEAGKMIEKSGGYSKINDAPLAAKNHYAANELSQGTGLDAQFMYENATKKGIDLKSKLSEFDNIRGEGGDTMQFISNLQDELSSSKSLGAVGGSDSVGGGVKVYEPGKLSSLNDGINADYVSSQRIAKNELKKLPGGSTRDVYVDGDRVIKVAKNPKGLLQNDLEGDSYLDFVPEVYEKGKDYVVSDYIPRNDAVTRKFLQPLQEFTAKDFDMKTSKLQKVLTDMGLEDAMNYDVLWNDFKAYRNWGVSPKKGKPVLIDGGALSKDITATSKVSDFATRDWKEVLQLRKSTPSPLPKSLEPLVKEARKYKSAEEFVKTFEEVNSRAGSPAFLDLPKESVRTRDIALQYLKANTDLYNKGLRDPEILTDLWKQANQ